jgi:acetyl esterase/lipase
VQTTDHTLPDVDEEWITVPGVTRARIVRPAGSTVPLPVVLCIHGAGRVFGNAHTHDRLVRELAVGAGAAVVFPQYDLSPEVRYPVALEQNYAVARWGSLLRAMHLAWTRAGWPSPVTPSAATWLPLFWDRSPPCGSAASSTTS